MAHFAELNENKEVLRVIVVNNEDILDSKNEENEEIGIYFCKKLFGQNTSWVQTSYNSNFRKNYAGIGMAFDEQRDAFIPIKPYPSWILNEDTCQWEAPIPKPEGNYFWDEEIQNWVEA